MSTRQSEIAFMAQRVIDMRLCKMEALQRDLDSRIKELLRVTDAATIAADIVGRRLAKQIRMAVKYRRHG